MKNHILQQFVTLMTILSLTISRCMCPAENAGCRDQPFTILYRVMDMVSGRSVPSDIFQMQATTRYPGAYYIFQIKSGNEGREFYMRVSLVLNERKHEVNFSSAEYLIEELTFNEYHLKLEYEAFLQVDMQSSALICRGCWLFQERN